MDRVHLVNRKSRAPLKLEDLLVFSHTTPSSCDQCCVVVQTLVGREKPVSKDNWTGWRGRTKKKKIPLCFSQTLPSLKTTAQGWFQKQALTVTLGFEKRILYGEGIKEGVENQYCRRHKACSVDSGGGARIHLAQKCRRPWLHLCLRQPLRNTPYILGPSTPTNHVNQYWLIAYLIICDT